MAQNSIFAAIDEEIRKLQQARALLTDLGSISVTRRVGRPKGSILVARKTKRRALSAEARAKIAAAQKKRWAAARKAKS